MSQFIKYTAREKYPELDQMLGCTFHQDFYDVYGSPEEAERCMIEEDSSRYRLEEVCKEIPKILADTDINLRAVLSDFCELSLEGIGVEPKQWLQDILRRAQERLKQIQEEEERTFIYNKKYRVLHYWLKKYFYGDSRRLYGDDKICLSAIVEEPSREERAALIKELEAFLMDASLLEDKEQFREVLSYQLDCKRNFEVMGIRGRQWLEEVLSRLKRRQERNGEDWQDSIYRQKYPNVARCFKACFHKNFYWEFGGLWGVKGFIQKVFEKSLMQVFIAELEDLVNDSSITEWKKVLLELGCEVDFEIIEWEPLEWLKGILDSMQCDFNVKYR